MAFHDLGESGIEGLGDAKVKKLKEIGVETVEELAVTPVRELHQIGIQKEAADFIREAKKLAGIQDYVSASKLKSSQVLKTGSTALDAIIGGGYECRRVTEVISSEGIGKSQTAFTACIMAQLPEEQGGLGGKVLYVDTEGSFKTERVREIAEARGLDAAVTLENIIYWEAGSFDAQKDAIVRAGHIIRENNVRLLVIDSLMAHPRVEYLGRENLPERQGEINQHLHLIGRRAQVYNLVAFLTNQVQANPTPFQDPTRPTGGHIVGHNAQLRLMLRRGPKGTKIARILDSSWRPPIEAVFTVNQRGIDDVVEEKPREIEQHA